MPRDNSTNWSVADQITATRLQAFNTEIDNILTYWSDKWRVIAAASASPLKVDIAAFSYVVWTARWEYAGIVDQSLTDNATNYIEIDSLWVLYINTSAWNSIRSRVWEVVTSGWVITSITDWRPNVVWGIFWTPTLDFAYPHDKDWLIPFAKTLTNLLTYTPTTWKVGYITYCHSKTVASIFQINSISVIASRYVGWSWFLKLHSPLLLDDTDILKMSSVNNWYIAWFEVDEDVELIPITTSWSYTVPAWKVYVILNIFYSTSGSLSNAFTIWWVSIDFQWPMWESISDTESSMNMPLILGAGDSVNVAINHTGYLIPAILIT